MSIHENKSKSRTPSGNPKKKSSGEGEQAFASGGTVSKEKKEEAEKHQRVSRGLGGEMRRSFTRKIASRDHLAT